MTNRATNAKVFTFYLRKDDLAIIRNLFNTDLQIPVKWSKSPITLEAFKILKGAAQDNKLISSSN